MLNPHLVSEIDKSVKKDGFFFSVFQAALYEKFRLFPAAIESERHIGCTLQHERSSPPPGGTGCDEPTCISLRLEQSNQPPVDTRSEKRLFSL